MVGEPAAKSRRPRRVTDAVGAAAAIAVILAALVALHHMTAGVRLSEILSDISAAPRPAILLALAWTAVSYVALAGYDVVAARTVAAGRVPWFTSAFSGMTGYAVSNFLGFHLLTGGAVRFRTYARSGLDAGEIGQVIVLSWTGLWLAFAIIVGAALVLDPDGIPLLDSLGGGVDRAIGLGLLALLALLLVRAGGATSEIRLLGWRVPLPARHLLLLQLVIGAVDIGASAAALYFLLPAGAQPGPALFVTVYMSAIILGAVSHVPGGAGVFEATLLGGLGFQGRSDVLAALVVYRLVYYLIPFLIAATFLAFLETKTLRKRIPAQLVLPARALKLLVPPVLSVIVFLSGIVLLFSSATPGVPERLESLEAWLPLPVVESSDFFSSIVGLALLIVAHGLRRRLYSAWAVALTMLITGGLLSLLKGGDWEEALILAGTAVLLVASRHAFYRRMPRALDQISWQWLALIALTLVATVGLGFFSYKEVAYSNELFWQFEWSGDVPRFLRASVGLVVAALVFGTYFAIHLPPTRKPAGAGGIPVEVAAIVEQSPDTQSNIAFLGDKEFLFSPSRRTFLMYARAGRSLIAMGDPVGDPAESEGLVWQLREMADRDFALAAFYAVQAEALPLYIELGYALLKLGEIARVDLKTFTLEGSKYQNHRNADRRAAKDGMAFEVIPRAGIAAIINELRVVSDAWLREKRSAEKGFSLGRFDPEYLARFDCAVMRKDGRIVAFANVWRSGGLNEMSVDLMRYRSDVSKVLMDAFFVRLMFYAKAQGYRWFNLGAAPLSGLPDHALASTWSRVAHFVFRHGEDFYRFEGLRAFKQKFSPVWTPQYLACPRGLNIPQVLLDVNTLISGGVGQVFARKPEPGIARTPDIRAA